MCCHTGRNRANASGETGSTLPRMAASDRIRSRRSTSASHHSVSSDRRASPESAAGRKKPLAMRPCASSRCSVEPGDRDADAEPLGDGRAGNGPCVRANRATRSPSGSATGSRKAFGMPTGSAAPSASRRRPASSIAATRADRPPMVTGIARRASDQLVQMRGRSASPARARWLARRDCRRAATSAASSGPSIRSRSATPSTPRARRSGSRRCASRSN